MKRAREGRKKKRRTQGNVQYPFTLRPRQKPWWMTSNPRRSRASTRDYSHAADIISDMRYRSYQLAKRKQKEDDRMWYEYRAACWKMDKKIDKITLHQQKGGRRARPATAQPRTNSSPDMRRMYIPTRRRETKIQFDVRQRPLTASFSRRSRVLKGQGRHQRPQSAI